MQQWDDNAALQTDSRPSQRITAVVDLLAREIHHRAEQATAVPSSTYRLQLQPGVFGFSDAADATSYLAMLGVSHVYASPYLKARTGSSHCYDVVDHGVLNPELGSMEDYERFVKSLRDARMGHILDVVPNHMSVASNDNAWWNDVLENGPASPFASYFDVDWNPAQEEIRGRVLLPVLGKHYGEALESGEIRLEYAAKHFQLRYFDRSFPLDPKTYLFILEQFTASEPENADGTGEETLELKSILTALKHLPDRTELTAEKVEERHREKEVVKRRLAEWIERFEGAKFRVDEAVAGFNGDPANPDSFDPLDRLIELQAYRLSSWKAASDEINYRRFFDVIELAAVAMERPAVFSAAHRLVMRLLTGGFLDGLRIDHVDGLADPKNYLRRLQETFIRETARRRRAEVAGEFDDDAWRAVEDQLVERFCTTPPLYVLIEKILQPSEILAGDWPTAGTTGYEFLNDVNGLFVDPKGYRQLEKSYRRFTGIDADFREMCYDAQRLILKTSLASDLTLLAGRLNRLSDRHRRSRDYTFSSLRYALQEIIACFSVYRTYITADSMTPEDRRLIHRAAAQAKRRNPATEASVFDFVRDMLIGEFPLDEQTGAERLEFVAKFQQLTSPVMAKGVEDTAIYRFFPLTSVNEVGGGPERPTCSIEEFHRRNLSRLRSNSTSMLAGTTHDSKRSEDVRARINILSEIPRQWRSAISRWARINRSLRRDIEGSLAPSRNDEYLFYQTLVGTWPIEPLDDQEHSEYVARLQEYMEKATREAKLRTSWINPDSDYDSALREFVAGALDRDGKQRFISDFQAFHEQIVRAGLLTAVAQLTLRLTSPGVPDSYQGQEVWEFRLVDPDNRRPVDFQKRRRLLERLMQQVGPKDEGLTATARKLNDNPFDPSLKLFVVWRLLSLRRDAADLFREGEYHPLETVGEQREQWIAFAWTSARRRLLVVAPRLLGARLVDKQGKLEPIGREFPGDAKISVPPFLQGKWLNILTGERVSIDGSHWAAADAAASFSTAVLLSEE